MGDPVYSFELPRGRASTGPDSILTELRIHGVSGPDPAGILETPAIFHVAGDAITGFARRLDGNAHGAGDLVDPMRPMRRLEAFSWRGVSSGSGTRALWLLLTPFALVNVAAWMHPIPRHEDSALPRLDPWQDSSVRTLHALLRAFAVGLTLLLTLATTAATIDVPARSSRAWLHGDAGTVRWLGAAASLLLVGLLWYLANKTWKKYDARQARTGSANDPAQDDNQPDYTTPLSSPCFWRAKESPQRQQQVHLVAAALLVVCVAAQPSIQKDIGRVLEVLLVVAGMGAAMHKHFSMADDLGDASGHPPVEPRHTATAPATAKAPFNPLSPAGCMTTMKANKGGSATLVVVLLLLVAGCAWGAVAALNGLSGEGSAKLTVADPYHLRVALSSILGALTLTAVAVGVVVVTMARAGADNRNHKPMLFGVATMWMTWLALFVAAVLSSAVVLSANKALIPNESVLQTPGFYQFVNIGAVVLVVAGALLAVFMLGFWACCFWGYTPDLIDYRIREKRDRPAYRMSCATAHFTRTAYIAVPLLSIAGLGWVGAGALYIALGKHAWAIPSLTALISAGLSGLLTLLLAIYRSVGDRRMVGVLWDVTTFWPRAVHPLAPPCYAERALPQLIDRVVALEQTGPVIVSGHSQGAMISSALFQQLSPSRRGHTALVTYGCQLSFLFARAFPAYAGGFVLDHLADNLDVPEAGPLEDHVYRLRWLNLFRLTDLLGSRVFLSDGYGQINREVADPRYARFRPSPDASANEPVYSLQVSVWPTTGDVITSTKPLGHSNYPASYEYRGAAYFLDQVLGHGTP